MKVIIEPRLESTVIATTQEQATSDEVLASLLDKSEHCVVHLCGCSCDC